MPILIIICLFLLIIIGYLYYKLQQHTLEEINIQEKNKKILEENNRLEFQKDSLKTYIAELELQIVQTKNNNNNIEEISNKALENYEKILENLYKEKEEEYDAAIHLLEESYDNSQSNLMAATDEIKKVLDNLSRARAAAIEAQLKEKEIKEKQAFYCPQVSESELKDVKILKDIEYKLNNPRILRMLIWTTFYQKPMNQICANILGAAAASKCGIYKITNQLNNLCYIGQSKDIATRWKNHAKAGLGIDTPVGNKLYKAMQEDGLENFSFEVLEECPASELNEKEKFYIELYQANEFGYNSINGHK